MSHRAFLLRQIAWFAILAALPVYLVAAPLWTYVQATEAHTWLYAITAFIGHFGLFVVLAQLVLSVIAVIMPYRLLIVPLAIVTTLAGLLLLFIDVKVYDLYRFHLSAFVWQLLVGDNAGQIFNFSWVTISVVVLVGIGALLVLIALWYVSYRIVRGRYLRYVGVIIALSWLLILVASQVMHAWYNAKYDARIARLNLHLPLYYPLTAKRLLDRTGIINASASRTQLPHNSGESFYYAADKLLCNASPRFNIVLILIDSLRFDAINVHTMPNLYRFGEQSQVSRYLDHYSGGNSTQAGVFSLFYGLPSTYWNTIEATQQSALWIDAMYRQGYDFGLFSSSSLFSPPFDRTVFSIVRDQLTDIRQGPGWQRDVSVLEDFRQFINQQRQGPFFGFLFLDAIHDYSFPASFDAPFRPWWERVDHVLLDNDFSVDLYHNRYRNAANWLDGQLADILATLNSSKYQDNTIIIITSDHGEAFNETRQNLWGHGSSFTRWQVKVPLYVRWPQREGKDVHTPSSHFDIAPTLINDALGCTVSPDAHSVGRSLWKPADKPWIVGSYFNYAAILEDKTIVTWPGGYYEVRDANNQVLAEHSITAEEAAQIVKVLSRFSTPRP